MPSGPDAHILQKLHLAAQQQHEGNLDAARTTYAEVLAVAPDNFDALHMSGVIAYQVGALEEADRLLGRAAQIGTNSPIVHLDYAAVLQALDRREEAIESYDKALAINPDHAAVHYNRGVLLRDLGRFDDLLTSFDRAIAIHPASADAHSARGATLVDLGRFDEAAASYDAMLSIRSSDPEGLTDRGTVFQAMGRYEEAIASYDAAISIVPLHIRALNNRAGTLKELGRDQEAIASLDLILKADPSHAEANYNRALFHLRYGELREGWRLYESRMRLPRIRDTAPDFGRPVWLGDSDPAGKSIIVHFEQGLGDTIHFCRYVPLLERLGAHVTFVVRSHLTNLLRTLHLRGKVVSELRNASAYDFQVPVMSLPFALRTDLSSIPNDIPYLHADSERVNRWSRKLGTDGIKIGICWQPGVGKGVRSFSPNEFRDISEIAGVRLISLQKGEGTKLLANLPADLKIESLGESFDAGPDGFLDSAAVMSLCDLVITTDTSIAHLGGALGVPTWVLLRHNPDWRWMTDRNDSPWYPTMRLFRQKSPGSWKPVFGEIRKALLERV